MRVELSRQQREDIEAKQKEIESFKRKLSGKSKTADDMTPESPRSEKKASSAKSGTRKQRAMFRVSVYNSAGHKVKPEDTVRVKLSNEIIQCSLATYTYMQHHVQV